MDILDEIRRSGPLDEKALAKIIHRHNRRLGKGERPYSKKRLLPYYLKTKEADLERWQSWSIDPALEKQLIRVLQVKPRRTASGVATITVITKPWKCSSDCLYCPNDLRMPKSYLSDEPACQRAERNFFDPYLQVASRLRALTHMGHATDKIELIILGGTWNDYPGPYRIWFMHELFRALNDGDAIERNAVERRAFYRACGLSNREDDLIALVGEKQREIDAGSLSYNKAMIQLYEENAAWNAVSSEQSCGFDALEHEQGINETARHRVVGLVVETRPDAITADNLTMLRRLGCTKIQMGIQSTDPAILAMNNRRITVETIRNAFELLRVFGFKIHAHFMLNLLGASPAADKCDYLRFVTDERYLPDEVKLYPCALVKGTRLCEHYDGRTWQPYREEELVEVLAEDTTNTPPFIRISRMIRDISAHDILAGNKKANLRQMVENSIEQAGKPIAEIRYREISTDDPAVEDLMLETIPYATTVSKEYFLQWVTPESRIAGFLRLSLPDPAYVLRHQDELPVKAGEAMIREVHVYGKVARLNATGEGTQHLGLGKQLIEAACSIAKDRGYGKINVISSVGTREYYRNLGFEDKGLYQCMDLNNAPGGRSPLSAS